MGEIMVPNPIRLFHITAIDNLQKICQSGKLLCKNGCDSEYICYQNIAHSGAQGARARLAVVDPPGGTIHDFVPFYFAPRSPMLYAINCGRVEGCEYRQEDILHFETTVDIISGTGSEIVFFDRNATLAYAQPYTDISEIAFKVAWDLITEEPRLDGYCKYFQDSHQKEKYVDRMEKRMAEFMVEQQVALSCMTRIGVISEEKAEIVRAILQKNSVELEVVVMQDWYF